MPIDVLLARLRGETDAQAAALVAQARADAARIGREAEVAANQVLAARLAAREAALGAETAAAVEAGRDGARRALLLAQHQAVQLILARIQERLPEIVADSRYLASVDAELAHAKLVLEGSDSVLSATPSVAARFPPTAGIEVQPDSTLLGFRFRSADGRVEVDGTLSGRMRRLTPRLAIAAARALEAET